ncbi:MAG TPA: FimV/HubP family polar landmark protein [Burkholderiaceae bacterium]|nr:FimV/HubP family polar landmark protein [Burkholderiaceae bacterium]HNB43259.1 FimV/HubP family polar landmark protein [Burkholderiaceae bacterium]
MSSLRLLSTSVLAASALMGLAPPALAAGTVDPAASAPIAAGDTLLPATVLRDNLWTLAARVQHDPGITRQQVMVAMLRRNPNAFLQGNMHRLRRDVALVVPTAREIAAENAGAAEAVVAAHLQALEQGTAVAPLAATTDAPPAAAKPVAKGASAAHPAAPVPAAAPASAARPAASQPLTAKEKIAAKPAVPAAPAVPPQAAATPTPPAEAAAPAASAVTAQPPIGSVIQAPTEVPAVVTPALPPEPAASTAVPAAGAAASAAAQAPVAGGDAGTGSNLPWWPALAVVALLGAAGMAWMRRRPGAAAADTAAPSSFFDENGVRRQSRPKLIDVSQAGVETARTVETLQAAAQMVRGAEARPSPALSPDDPYREATIKLEIARTSLELGRVEVAKAMLQAVRREGSAAQQILAGDLLHSLSPS